VALHFCLDASALAKRYVAEVGSPVINHLFGRVTWNRLTCLMLGALEVVSLLVRRKNSHRLPFGVFNQILADFRNEVFDAVIVQKLPATEPIITAALTLVDRHSLNASDAVLLQAALEFADYLRASGDDLVLVASDRRLLRAAQAEGLQTFDPESQTEADVDALLGP
jgi:predicted nucleic acid-binding protein